jgi:hypothetical protein
VSLQLFCILFFVFGLCLDRTYFIEEKFFVGFKIASDIQDGSRKSKKHNIEIWQHFCIQPFAMSLYFDQKHYPKSCFGKLAENGESMQDGGSKSESLALLWKLSVFFQSVCLH